MISLRLALRGLLARFGLALSLLAVTAFAVATASAGAIYLRSAGESVLQDTLRSAPPGGSGLSVIDRITVASDVDDVQAVIDAARRALPAFRPPISGMRSVNTIGFGRPGIDPVQSRLATRDQQCRHLRVVAGRCPRPAPLTLPAEAAIPESMARALGAKVGTPLTAERLTVGKAPRSIVVVGIYRPAPSDPWAFGGQLFSPASQPGGAEGPVHVLEAVMVDQGTLLAAVGGPSDLQATWDLALDPPKVQLADAPNLGRVISTFQAAFVAAYPNVEIRTSLPALVDQAEAGRAALTVPVLLTSLQLLALGLLILVVVSAMAAEARAGEVALAKVRGATTGQAFLLATLELAIVAVCAVPVGLALGWAGVRLLADHQLVRGVPVVLSPLAAGAALTSGVAALAAASAAGIGAVRRRVLEQWRQTRSGAGARRTALVEIVLLAVAAVSLFNLRQGGASAGDAYDPLAVLAPSLAVLTGALVAGRVLPFVAGGLVKLTSRSRSLAGFIGSRQVARRGGPALRVVVTLAAAFGLMAFAITVRQDLAKNRSDRAFTEIGAGRRASVTFPNGSLGPERVDAADPSGRQATAVVRYTSALHGSGRELTVLAVESARYAGVGYWRRDFSSQPIGRLLQQLRPASPVRPLDLGAADELEVDLGTLNVRLAGRLTLLAELRSRSGQEVAVSLGPIVPGQFRRYAASLSPSRLRAEGPWQLERFSLERDLGHFFDVNGTFLFDTVGVRSGGASRVLERFDDPAAWYSRNSGDYEPADVLTAERGADGKALALTVAAPSTAPTLGLVHASLPREVPVIATPAVLAAEGLRPGQPISFSAPAQGLVLGRVLASAAVVPGAGADMAVLADLDTFLGQVRRDPTNVVAANEVWTTGDGPGAAVLDRLRRSGVQIVEVTTAAEREAVLAHEAPALALLLLVVGAAAGAVLAATGVMLHLYLSGRRRRFELAALEALGARRRDLWSPLAVEQGALLGYGVLVGGAIGVGVALIALPAIPQFLDRPEVPAPIYVPDWAALSAALGIGILLVAAGLAVVIATLVRQARPALLREADR